MDTRGEEIVGVKSISFSVETFSFYQKNKKTGLHPFRQIFWDLREDTMDLILVKKNFNYFNFYNIDILRRQSLKCIVKCADTYSS